MLIFVFLSYLISSLSFIVNRYFSFLDYHFHFLFFFSAKKSDSHRVLLKSITKSVLFRMFLDLQIHTHIYIYNYTYIYVHMCVCIIILVYHIITVLCKCCFAHHHHRRCAQNNCYSIPINRLSTLSIRFDSHSKLSS